MDLGFYVQAKYVPSGQWQTLQPQTALPPEKAGEMCRALQEKTAIWEKTQWTSRLTYPPEYRVVQLVEIS